jgi:hypothetical protein
MVNHKLNKKINLHLHQATFFRFPFSIFHLTFTMFLFLACPEQPEDKPPPGPPQNNSINLEIVSTNTYTAQLRISIGDTLADWTYSLYRNGEEFQTSLVFSTDTSITDSNLTANTEYIYKAYMINDVEIVDSSASVTINTLEEIINLELISTFTTTSRFRISIPDSTLTWSFDLYRDGNNVLTTNVNQKDTIIVDGGLSPNTQYSYQAFWINEDIAVDTSENVTAQTMDTTSHNFTWEIDTLGGYGSYLKDVAIIDENNIWVVGMIKIPDPDSSFNGTGWEDFNAAHWDGVEWELLKIFNGSLTLYSIEYFSEDDIWVTSHCFPYHWDGIVWTQYHLNDMGMSGVCAGNAIEGTSSEMLYFVGDNGSIVHYDGSAFTELESDTEVDLEDIDGTEDGEHVFISGFDLFGYNNTSPLLHIHNGEITKVYESTYPWGNEEDWGRIEAIEVIGDTVYMATWGRDWIAYNYLTDEYIEYFRHTIPSFVALLVREISSNEKNDMIAVSAFGEVLHFNGLSWYRDSQIYSVFGDNFVFKGSDFNNNDLVVVGRLVGWVHGIVVRGYRN